MYKLKKISPEMLRTHLQDVLIYFSSIDVEELTTAELYVLRKFAENPPEKTKGIEEKLA